MNHDLIFPTKSSCRAVWKATVLCVITCLLAVAVSATPAVKLSTASGPPTTNVKISGSGFPASSLVDLYFDSTNVVLVVSSATGTFSNIPLKVPAIAQPGTHWVTAVVRASGLAAQKSFLVRTNWMQWGFTPSHNRVNPYENVLNSSNVGSIDLAWNFPVLSYMSSSAAVANGAVYVGDEGGSFYALSVKTGAYLWGSWGEWGFSPPAVANGVVYVCSEKLYALDTKTGANLWSFSIPSAYNFCESAPTVANGVVYVAFNDWHLYALNARTGAKLWSAKTGASLFTSMGTYFSSPAVANGVVYVGSKDSNVYALSASTGVKLWSFLTGGQVLSSPAVANGVLYVGSVDKNVYALSASTGAKLWSFATGNSVLSSPAVANGVVYVGSDDGKVYAINASTGTKLWSFPTGANVSSSPVVANGVVYVGSHFWGSWAEARIYALNARTGAKLWSFLFPTGVLSSPVVADGVIYVNAQGGVYAFDLAGGMLAKAQSVARPDPAYLIPDYTLQPQ
jgi:outer membrane protein assembly factor BamB